jgi:hypothetical protein
MSDPLRQMFNEALEELNMQEQSQQLLLAEANRHGDRDGRVSAVQALVNIDVQKQALVNRYNTEAQRNQPQYAPYVSPEQRAARNPWEMDCQDIADIMNTSKFKGRGFSAQDYYNLRRRGG